MSPLFRKKTAAPVVAAAPEPAPQPEGDRACLRFGCSNTNGVECAYVDRRSRRCETAWCPEHRHLIANGTYCPRHAGIMFALLASPRKGHLPDIDNRAPSLANWIGNDIDGRIRRILESVISPEDQEQMIAEPVGYVFGMHDKSHRWERAWKLANHTGVTLKASVDVDEARDSVVRARVGQRTVTNVIPPWVEHHQRHEMVSPEQDKQERTDFYSRLCQLMSDAVLEERRIQSIRPYFGPDAEGQQTVP